MANNNNGISGSSFLFNLLLVAFIVLKLCKVINWSWWWVLSPLWIPIAIGLILLPFVIKSKAKKKKEWEDFKPKSKWQERLEEMQKNKSNIHN